MLSKRLLQTVSLVFLVGAFWGGAGVLTSPAQSIPSWAESQAQHHKYGDRGREPLEERTNERSDPSKERARSRRWNRRSDPNETGNLTGGMTSKRRTTKGCNVSKDCPGYPNAYCAPDKGRNGMCFSNGGGPGNGENGDQKPPSVPIGGWAWLAVAGIGYGVYRQR